MAREYLLRPTPANHQRLAEAVRLHPTPAGLPATITRGVSR